MVPRRWYLTARTVPQKPRQRASVISAFILDAIDKVRVKERPSTLKILVGEMVRDAGLTGGGAGVVPMPQP